MKTYRAINPINCNGQHCPAGEIITPSEAITEQSLQAWAKKGLVSVNGEVIEQEIATPDANTETVPGRSRTRRGKKDDESEDAE